MISIVDSFVLVVVPYLPVYVGPNLDALNTNSFLELCLGANSLLAKPLESSNLSYN